MQPQIPLYLSSHWRNLYEFISVRLSVCQYSYLYLSRIFLFEVFPHYQQQLNAGPGPFFGLLMPMLIMALSGGCWCIYAFVVSFFQLSYSRDSCTSYHRLYGHLCLFYGIILKKSILKIKVLKLRQYSISS